MWKSTSVVAAKLWWLKSCFSKTFSGRTLMTSRPFPPQIAGYFLSDKRKHFGSSWAHKFLACQFSMLHLAGDDVTFPCRWNDALGTCHGCWLWPRSQHRKFFLPASEYVGYKERTPQINGNGFNYRTRREVATQTRRVRVLVDNYTAFCVNNTGHFIYVRYF